MRRFYVVWANFAPYEGEENERVAAFTSKAEALKCAKKTQADARAEFRECYGHVEMQELSDCPMRELLRRMLEEAGYVAKRERVLDFEVEIDDSPCAECGCVRTSHRAETLTCLNCADEHEFRPHTKAVARS